MMRRPSRGVLGATVVLLALAAGWSSVVLAGAEPAGVKLYPNANQTEQVGGVFKRCLGAHHRRGKVELIARTTNHNWELIVTIRRWVGLNHRYVLHYGSIRPGFLDVESQTSNQSFSTAFAPPSGPTPLHPAGSVRFNNSGSVVAIDGAPANIDYSDSILVHGALSCHEPD